MAGNEELTGTDGVIVHRLLKNTVRERLNLGGCSLLTEPCIDALGLDPHILGMAEHRESYDDIGEVVAFVQDLDVAWQRVQERRRVLVTRVDAGFEFTVELPASVDVLWDFTTSPRKRLLWLQDFTAINQTNPSDRRGPGTTNHCVHGRAAITEEILDWHSFQYFTQRMDIPMMGPWVQTYEFSPVGSDVTELRIRIERLRGRRRLLLRVMQRRLAKGMRENTDRLAAVLREETSRSGRLPPLHDRHRLGGRFRRR